jgi:hypothetical protein
MTEGFTMQRMKESTRAAVATLSVLAACGSVHGQFVHHFDAMPDQKTFELVVGDVKITAESGGAAARVVVQNGDGLGVEGGASDAMNLDEKLIFEFDGICTSSVSYRAHAAADADGDGQYGESEIVAIDLTGERFLGYPVYGRGPNHLQFVNRAVEGAAVAGFEIDSDSTSMWIAALRADNQGDVTVIDFTDMGTFTDTSLTVGDVEITAQDEFGASGTLTVFTDYGLAVQGGTSDDPDYRVSDLEALIFKFAGVKPDAVSYVYDRLVSGDHGDGDSDGDYGESVMTPLDTATSLWYFERAHWLADGGVIEPWEDPVPFAANPVAGWAPFDGFRLDADPVSADSFRVEKIAYCVMEQCYPDCNGDGVLNILDFVCFQGEFTSGCP